MKKKEIENIISITRKLLEEDPLKAWVFLNNQELNDMDKTLLQGIWMKVGKDWRKEAEKLGKGREDFDRSIIKEIQKLRRKEAKKLYKKFFSEKEKEG